MAIKCFIMRALFHSFNSLSPKPPSDLVRVIVLQAIFAGFLWVVEPVQRNLDIKNCSCWMIPLGRIKWVHQKVWIPWSTDLISCILPASDKSKYQFSEQFFRREVDNQQYSGFFIISGTLKRCAGRDPKLNPNEFFNPILKPCWRVGNEKKNFFQD